MTRRKRRTSSAPPPAHAGDKRAARDHPGRDRSRSPRWLWLYGRHAVAAALANPTRRCRRLVASPSALADLDHRPDARLRRPGLRVETVPRAEFGAALPRGALSPGAVHQGLALEVAALEAPTIEAACALPDEPEATPVVVVLDRVSDPQNLGAALRAAAAFGARAVVLPERHAPSEGGALAKAASGALECVPLVRVTNLARALQTLKRLDYWCVGLDAAASDPLAAAKPGGAVALVFGAEGAGLRRLTREHCDLLARVPISSAVESLNLAAAVAVALYEIAGRDA
ncbi:MAG: TrmH family RNA methyltransferase [Alphaproteobacteria bacterium]